MGKRSRESAKSRRVRLKQALRIHGLALEHLSEKLKGDKELVLAAVLQDGNALLYASEELKGDKELVLAAVRQDGYALFYASEELRVDWDVVLEAVRQYSGVLPHISQKLTFNRKFMLKAVKMNGLALQHAPLGLRGDPEVSMEAVRQNPAAYKYSTVMCIPTVANTFNQEELLKHLKCQIGEHLPLQQGEVNGYCATLIFNHVSNMLSDGTGFYVFVTASKAIFTAYMSFVFTKLMASNDNDRLVTYTKLPEKVRNHQWLIKLMTNLECKFNHYGRRKHEHSNHFYDVIVPFFDTLLEHYCLSRIPMFPCNNK